MKKLSKKQLKSRKINQVNYVLHGVKNNLETQHRLLIELGLHSSAFEIFGAINKISDTILSISKERKL